MVKPSPMALSPAAHRRPSLADVARRAGVAVATASYALRNHPKIPEPTRQRVREAADALGYQVNATVGRLMAELRPNRPESGLTTLAWINSHPDPTLYHTRPWLRGWLNGARSRANHFGFRLEEMWMEDPALGPERLRQILRTRAIPGLILAPTRATGGVFAMDCSSFSVVTMARTFRQPQLHQAAADDFANLTTAFEGLRNLGYQRIGFFSMPLVCEWTDQRQIGAFLQASSALPPSRRLPPLVRPEESPEGFAAFRKWVRRWKPDALISPSRTQLEWLAELGIQVPRDCGYAHLNLAGDVAGWAGIDPRIEGIAASAVDMLIGQIHRHETAPPPVPRELLIRGAWVQGSTVRPQSLAGSSHGVP